MHEFSQALDTVLTFQPLVTLSLAAVGLATVFFLFWQILSPVLSYLSKSGNHLVTFWCIFLLIAGGTFIGLSYDTQHGAFLGAGIGSAVFGFLVLAFYWLRKWVKWLHNEKE